MKKIILPVVFVVIAAGAALFMFSRTGTSPAPKTDTKPVVTSDVPVNATITYTDAGFSPKDLKVKVGDIINVVNNSSHSLQFSSDPHPVHTKNAELNAQTISAGASLNITVSTKGTFGFHDHLDSTKTGTLVVE